MAKRVRATRIDCTRVPLKLEAAFDAPARKWQPPIPTAAFRPTHCCGNVSRRENAATSRPRTGVAVRRASHVIDFRHQPNILDLLYQRSAFMCFTRHLYRASSLRARNNSRRARGLPAIGCGIVQLIGHLGRSLGNLRRW